MHRRCTSGHSSYLSLPEAVRIHGCDTLRHGQAPSGAVRNAPKRSASILVQPSSSAMTVTIATRATDTLHCFNGLQQPQRPSRPQAPEKPQRPQGWMLSFDSHHPIHKLSVKNQNFWLFTFSRFLMDANRNFLQCRCKAHCVNANTVITSIPKKGGDTMEKNKTAKTPQTRGSFSGRIGYVLAMAGSAVGLGNIWRFPYLAAKYGGGIFLLVYLVLVVTFGYTLLVSETALGRMTKKSPVGAFQSFGNTKTLRFGGWINAIIPMLIVPYYSVIGGWVLKYLFEYIKGNAESLAQDGYFTAFIGSSVTVEFWQG